MTSIMLEHCKGGLQGVLRCPVGGIQPPSLLNHFQNHAILLQTLQSWIHQEMEMFGNSVGRAMVEDTITTVSNQTQDGCRAAGLDAGGVPPCSSMRVSLCNTAAERPLLPLLLLGILAATPLLPLLFPQSRKGPRLNQVRLYPGLPLPGGAVNAPLKGHSNS